MMGFGMMSPLSWLLGVLAMVAIWGGVWWGLSTLVFHWPARNETARPVPPAPLDQGATWEQPPSPPPDRPATDPAGGPLPLRRHTSRSGPPRSHLNTGSDYR